MLSKTDDGLVQQIIKPGDIVGIYCLVSCINCINKTLGIWDFTKKHGHGMAQATVLKRGFHGTIFSIAGIANNQKMAGTPRHGGF